MKGNIGYKIYQKLKRHCVADILKNHIIDSDTSNLIYLRVYAKCTMYAWCRKPHMTTIVIMHNASPLGMGSGATATGPAPTEELRCASVLQKNVITNPRTENIFPKGHSPS